MHLWYAIGMPWGRSHKKFQLPRTKIRPPPRPSEGLCSKSSTSDLSDCSIFYWISCYSHIYWTRRLNPGLINFHSIRNKVVYSIFAEKCRRFFMRFWSVVKVSLIQNIWPFWCCKFFGGQKSMFQPPIKPIGAQMMFIRGKNILVSKKNSAAPKWSYIM